MSDDFQRSLDIGLRVEGSEQSVEGARHRRRYRFATHRLLELPVTVVLDHGCGAGYGTRMIKDALGPGTYVAGYEPDGAARAHAITVGQIPVYDHYPPHWSEWTEVPRSARCIVTFGVLEHIARYHPSDMLETFLHDARYVVGFFPYKEPNGNNPNHFWFGLDESVFVDLGAKRQLYFEPASGPCAWNDESVVDAYYEKWAGPRPSAWQSGDNRDPINVLFVLERP